MFAYLNSVYIQYTIMVCQNNLLLSITVTKINLSWSLIDKEKMNCDIEKNLAKNLAKKQKRTCLDPVYYVLQLFKVFS